MLRRSGYAKAQLALAEAAGNLTKLPVCRPRVAEALAEAQAEREGGLKIYNRENDFKEIRINGKDSNWSVTGLMDTISFNDNDTLIIEISVGCVETEYKRLLIDNIKVEKCLFEHSQ